MDISTSISSQHLHPGIRAWHALEHSHKQAWRGLATKLRRPPHEGLLERRSYCPRPRFCTQWASYDRHEKLQRARCPRAHARGARPRGIASRPSSASRAGRRRGLRQNQPKNAPAPQHDSRSLLLTCLASGLTCDLMNCPGLLLLACFVQTGLRQSYFAA